MIFFTFYKKKSKNNSLLWVKLFKKNTLWCCVSYFPKYHSPKTSSFTCTYMRISNRSTYSKLKVKYETYRPRVCALCTRPDNLRKKVHMAAAEAPGQPNQTSHCSTDHILCEAPSL